MSDYDYDAAMDQLAEWEEEERMEEYNAQQWEEWQDAIYSSPTLLITSLQEELETNDHEDPDAELLSETLIAEDLVFEDFQLKIMTSGQQHGSTTAILQKIEKEAEQQITPS